MLEKWRSDALNLMALTCLQASNAVIPLLIVPFVIARLGAAAYANVAIAEAISMIAVAIVLYSFEVDGVSRISGTSLHDDKAHLSRISSTIFAARILLFLAISTIILIATSIFSSLPLGIVLFWLLVPLGQIFHAYWFYQGVEFNIPPAILTLIARLISLGLVIACVHTPAEGILVPLFIGGPYVVAGILSTAYREWSLNIHLRWPGLNAVREYIQDGHRIFAGTAAVMLYREMNVLLMSIAGVPAAAIGSYSLAEKSIKMIQAITRPLNQIAFPKTIRALKQFNHPDPRSAMTVLKYTVPQILAVIVVLITLCVSFDRLSPYIPALRNFRELPNIYIIFLIVLPAPIFGVANFMFGSAGLNFLGDQRYLLKAILLTGVVSIIGCLALSHLYGAIGAAICFCGAELLLLTVILARYKTWRIRPTGMRSSTRD